MKSRAMSWNSSTKVGKLEVLTLWKHEFQADQKADFFCIFENSEFFFRTNRNCNYKEIMIAMNVFFRM